MLVHSTWWRGTVSVNKTVCVVFLWGLGSLVRDICLLLLSWQNLYLGHLLLAWLYEGVKCVWFVLKKISFVIICSLSRASHCVVICEDRSVVKIFYSWAFTAQNEIHTGLNTAFSEIGLRYFCLRWRVLAERGLWKSRSLILFFH